MYETGHPHAVDLGCRSAQTGPHTQASSQVQLRAKDGVVSFDVSDGETVLCAGLRQGMALPYECATGTCGSCRASLIEGGVLNLWPEATGAKFLRPNRADHLLCQTALRGRCVFELPQAPKEFGGAVRPDHYTGSIAQSRLLAREMMYVQIKLDKRMPFAAGQFFLLGTNAVEGRRAYSLANDEDVVSEIEIVVRRKPNGSLTEWLFSQDRTGERVQMFGPLGSAMFDPINDRNLLCIVGGSGLAGALAILSRAAALGHFRRYAAQVFFGVRTLQHAFFLDRLSDLAAGSPNLTVTVALSDEIPDVTSRRYRNLRFAHGFVHEVARDEMRGRYSETTAFLAGPPPMVEAAIRVLVMEAKLPARSIRYDKFS